jgi:hypothetical protein
VEGLGARSGGARGNQGRVHEAGGSRGRGNIGTREGGASVTHIINHATLNRAKEGSVITSGYHVDLCVAGRWAARVDIGRVDMGRVDIGGVDIGSWNRRPERVVELGARSGGREKVIRVVDAQLHRGFATDGGAVLIAFGDHVQAVSALEVSQRVPHAPSEMRLRFRATVLERLPGEFGEAPGAVIIAFEQVGGGPNRGPGGW